MKTISIFIFLAITSIAAKAQSFILSPNPVEKQTYAENGDLILFSTMTNNSTDSVFTWQRFENTKPADWESEVCDPTACLDVHVDSASFYVAPGTEGYFRITFINPNRSPGNAVTCLMIYARYNITNIDTICFIGQAYGTSINENTFTTNLGIYPSPVSSELNLAYKATQPLIAEIYNLSGVKVASFTYFNDTYKAGDLKAGIYLVRLYDGEKVLTGKFAKTE